MAEKTEKTKDTGKKAEDNVVYIGNKPFMNYVTGVVMQFTKQGSDKVEIRARGKFISRAVDVAEVARRRFLSDKNIEVDGIKIGSEEFKNKEGKQVNVSTIEISLARK
jgi:DNA-binding protein